ncbi:3-deoxy-D-manno-octulosonic acid transferase [compost metagenome]
MLSGPHLFNFLEIATQLRDKEALQEVTCAEELAERVQILLDDQVARSAARQAGLAVLHANQGALTRLLEGLEKLQAKPAVG